MELYNLLNVIKTNEDLDLKQLIVGQKYNVIESYYVLDDLILNNYGVGIYLGTFLNENFLELLFYFENEEHKNTNGSSSYCFEYEFNKFITVYRFYDISNLKITLID